MTVPGNRELSCDTAVQGCKEASSCYELDWAVESSKHHQNESTPDTNTEFRDHTVVHYDRNIVTIGTVQTLQIGDESVMSLTSGLSPCEASLSSTEASLPSRMTSYSSQETSITPCETVPKQYSHDPSETIPKQHLQIVTPVML